MERLEVLDAFADGGEQDRRTGDLADRERRPAACVTVELREDDAVETDDVGEGASDRSGLLPDHRVDDEQRPRCAAEFVCDVDDGPCLAQQLLVDVQASGGVDDDRVVPGERRTADRLARDGDGVALGDRRMHGDSGARGDDAQLLDGSRPLQVAGDEHRSAALRRQMLRELAGDGRLARTLQAGEDDDGGCASREVERDVLATERCTQLRIDRTHDVLTRIEPGRDVRSDKSFAQPLDDAAHHGEVDVRLEQREPDVAQDRVDRTGIESPATAQPVECATQALLQGIEHGGLRIGRRSPRSARCCPRLALALLGLSRPAGRRRTRRDRTCAGRRCPHRARRASPGCRAGAGPRRRCRRATNRRAS